MSAPSYFLVFLKEILLWCNSSSMYPKEPWFKPIKKHPDKIQLAGEVPVDQADKVDPDRVLIANKSGL